MKAVILAGGRGRRLEPYTTVLPKPLMPVQDRPVIEIIIRKLVSSGFDEVHIAAGHLASLLQAYLGDGSRYGALISYSVEPSPLGTIGPLRLLRDELKDEPFLVMNGDVLTDMDLREFWEFHLSTGTLLTIAVTERKIDMDFGVAEIENDRIVGYHEKPTISHWVSMGIYAMRPDVLELIPEGYFDLPQLVHNLIGSGEVAAFKHRGFWLDIGREDDFRYAQELSTELLQKIMGLKP